MSRDRRNASDPAYAGTIAQEFFQEVKEYAIFLLDSNGNVASWNEGARRIKGYTRDEILGRHFSVFYPPEHDHTPPETVLSLAARHGSYDEKGWRLRKDDSKFWAQVTVRALYDSDDELDGFAKIVRDITETREYQQELKRNRDRLARTEHLADVGGWELDFDSREINLTDGAKHLFEIPTDRDVSFVDVVESFHRDDAELIEDAIQNARWSGEMFDLELRIITAAGRKRWVQIRGDATHDGETIRGALRDVSARKEREERLMVLNRVLRHNLRNNLNVVSGYANDLKRDLEQLDFPSVFDDGDQQLDGVLEELMRTTAGIDAELEALDKMVSAVSEFSTGSAVHKTERIIENSRNLMATGEKAREFEQAVKNHVGKTPVDAESVFEDLEETYERKYPRSEIRTDHGGQTVLASEHSLNLALGELVRNAITHSDQPEPFVTLEADRLSDERVEISVTDDGPGIPDNEQEILKQGKETALTHGDGMGLWTVHWVVTQLGGEVSIETRDSSGTTVSVLLPAPQADGE